MEDADKKLIYEEEQKAKTKEEIAEDLNLEIPKDNYWGNVPSKICGTIGGARGGNYVKNAVEDFEKSLIKK